MISFLLFNHLIKKLSDNVGPKTILVGHLIHTEKKNNKLENENLFFIILKGM